MRPLAQADLEIVFDARYQTSRIIDAAEHQTGASPNAT